MSEDMNMLIRQLERNPGVSEDQIKQLKNQLDFQLPDDYLYFLRESNGGEGPIGENNYLSLWKTENLVGWNNMYNVHTYAPGYFVFGSNGGGTAYAFNKNDNSIVEFEFIGMLMDGPPTILGNDFMSFLRALYENSLI